MVRSLMAPPPVSVQRGSSRGVRWLLWSDDALASPRLLPDGGYVALQVTRGATSIALRSDEDAGLVFDLGNEADDRPASVIWFPTDAQSRLITGRARVEIEYVHQGEQIPLLPPRAFIDFEGGDNDDEQDPLFVGRYDGRDPRQSALNLLLLRF